MFKHYFEQVNNVAIWPIISLTIFFVFFLGLVIYVTRIRKDYIKHMEDLPLRDGIDEQNSFTNKIKNS